MVPLLAVSDEKYLHMQGRNCPSSLGLWREKRTLPSPNKVQQLSLLQIISIHLQLRTQEEKKKEGKEEKQKRS